MVHDYLNSWISLKFHRCTSFFPKCHTCQYFKTLLFKCTPLYTKHPLYSLFYYHRLTKLNVVCKHKTTPAQTLMLQKKKMWVIPLGIQKTRLNFVTNPKTKKKTFNSTFSPLRTVQTHVSSIKKIK